MKLSIRKNELSGRWYGLAFFILAIVLTAWWLRREPEVPGYYRDIDGKLWPRYVEDDDGIQPVDPWTIRQTGSAAGYARAQALAAAEARGWMTAAEEDVVYGDWWHRAIKA